LIILVDTSVWIEHLRQGQSILIDRLMQGSILTHSFVIGELACGNLKNRTEILTDLQALPAAVAASDNEVMRLIESRRLWGLGIGWIDAHLIASALLSKCQFWTLDKRLSRAAASAGITTFAE
jgi:predicted nucleic acid-binding protein